MNNNKKFTKINFRDNEFNLLRHISSSPEISQRKLAHKMGFSLGKLNYCLKELRIKGFLKIENFKKNPNKFSYIYTLTPRGVAIKTRLTISFMKRKMKEYEELKQEINEKK
jgi:EPS-associated MarR family transcriptional regulator